MSDYIAALPMYNWDERSRDVDAEWEEIRDHLRSAGVGAPARLARSNADLPPVPGGISDESGQTIAPDPATLPRDELDRHALWTHPNLLLSQTCWGPMELGLARHVRLVGQPDYSNYEGGRGECYSSAIIMRRPAGERDVPAPEDGRRMIPVERIRGRRFAFNGSDSMSGVIALTRDLTAIGESLDIFSDRVLSGGHRNSIIAVAEGEADVAAIDCMSWALGRRFEPAAERVVVVGWTAHRKGLPYICSRHLPERIFQSIRAVMSGNTREGGKF